MLNVVALNGRLTADPELKHTQNDIAVTSFSIAVERSYAGSNGERKADFITIVCWRGTAEFASKYFHKGQLVAVEGSIQTRSYTDRDGNKRRAFEVVAGNVHFAESKRAAESQGGVEQPAGSTQGCKPQSFSQGADSDFVEIEGDDDLPF